MGCVYHLPFEKPFICWFTRYLEIANPQQIQATYLLFVCVWIQGLPSLPLVWDDVTYYLNKNYPLLSSSHPNHVLPCFTVFWAEAGVNRLGWDAASVLLSAASCFLKKLSTDPWIFLCIQWGIYVCKLPSYHGVKIGSNWNVGNYIVWLLIPRWIFRLLQLITTLVTSFSLSKYNWLPFSCVLCETSNIPVCSFLWLNSLHDHSLLRGLHACSHTLPF